MDTAIALLRYAETSLGAAPKNTGWKNGFGMAVASPIPIEYQDAVAQVETDGSEISFTRISGSPVTFDALCSALCRLTQSTDAGAA